MTGMNNNMKFYRYEIETRSHYGYDMDGNMISSNIPPTVTLKLLEYDLLRETDCGYWICSSLTYHFWKKWIPKKSKKRYAYPTKEEALLNFKKRTEIRAKILTNQLDACNYGLILANKI